MCVCVYILFDVAFVTPSDIVYGVATISRLLQIIDLFCKRAHKRDDILQKETYNLKEPTHHSLH